MSTLDEQMNTGTEITARARSFIQSTSPWLRFIGIFGMVISVLIIIMAFVVIFSGGLLSSLFDQMPGMSGFPLTIFGIIYLLLGALMFFLNFLLFKAGNGYKNFVQTNRIESLEDALGRQKTYWTIVGVLTLIGVMFYALAIIGGIIAGLVAM